jgi:alkanesulfonate monooxygenase SsuD/methylene tetrahydromethanopterin reductase-like flavin-dependent oxidoreductase (luciferase family)
VKVCLLGPAAYVGRVDRPGWPVPNERCDPETAATSYRIQLEQYQLADELGFDWVSISEHHYAPGLMTPNPVVLAAAASQRTTRVKIALLGPLMPLSNPVRVAEEVAMLDSISGGRVVVLFLRGTPNEQSTYSSDGRAAADTRGITQEATLLILKAWQEREPFSWHGEHFSFEHVSVWPRTLQEPHPPAFYSGNSQESIEFAAANHLNLAIGFAPVAQVAANVRLYVERAADAGWTPTHDNVLYRARALVANSDDEAAAITERTRAAMARTASGGAGHPAPSGATSHRPPGEGGGAPNMIGYQFFGTTKTIVEQVAVYREVGVGIVDLAFSGEAFGRGGTRRALHEFAEVLPSIQAL